jgi:hypothetical protein
MGVAMSVDLDEAVFILSVLVMSLGAVWAVLA